MVKKRNFETQSDKTGLTLVALVGIVALIGVVAIVVSVGSADSDLQLATGVVSANAGDGSNVAGDAKTRVNREIVGFEYEDYDTGDYVGYFGNQQSGEVFTVAFSAKGTGALVCGGKTHVMGVKDRTVRDSPIAVDQDGDGRYDSTVQRGDLFKMLC